ncbi:hypothetical protein BU24DRAFT_463015 [Aaosphaeria arxii CBS 175.79]|uniref:Clr5 domain-containing protein n=1 Tax=Aaosphaeria arxii CBS 175.79 TaxID=1450172 RepID=A0A6A5XMY1_9PLEO|nr:uncharacterized protein BU24DRAFT_463015 [Aaosphaeria arxii CBS 175.79]KAF2014207.1 hypothetical protein BU24DRAFT_463015 [Aaosphaeria arxii CBS 175.79]
MSRVRLNWNEWKDTIIDVYVTQDKSRSEVLEFLNAHGFEAKDRTLKAWIQRWKLQKTNNERDMRTAVQLAIDYQQQNPDNWNEDETNFRIQHRTVEFKDVRRYFKRKNIHDPFEWFKSLPPEDYQSSDHVHLIPRGEFVLTPVDQRQSPELTPEEEEEEEEEEAEYVDVEEDPVNSLQLVLPSPAESPIPRTLAPPTQLWLNEKLIWCAEVYCASFVDSTTVFSPREPPVHMHTLHGKFGAKMQDGIFHASQNNFDLATKDFEKAHELLDCLVPEADLMAFAQVFTILCELSVASQQLPMTQPESGVNPFFLKEIRRLTLDHLLDVARKYLKDEHPLRQCLEILQEVEDIHRSLVESMHKMVDISLQGPNAWTGLYLMERYCDCLYHAGISGERQTQRARLLQLQESQYGKTRGNVLWTLTNVADDYLEMFQFKRAEECYSEALQRADFGLGGYAKAKIRFAAFEGLARVALVRSQVQSASAAWGHSASGFNISLQQSSSRRLDGLTEALRNLHLAEAEALKRSDFSSRRLARVCLSREVVQKEIENFINSRDAQ